MGKKNKSGRGKAGSAEAEKQQGPERWLLQSDLDPNAGTKHALYQRAVQSPKGDISYLVKFFLMYVGGRAPLHLREDFCGTALICSEWLRADARRTALGLDLDEDALRWGLRENLSSFSPARIRLLLGNVLESDSKASHISTSAADMSSTSEAAEESPAQGEEQGPSPEPQALENATEGGGGVGADTRRGKADGGGGEGGSPWEGADVSCAFNFSTCCLHRRADLVRYFRLARGGLSPRGGIFALDLYGGASSECALKLRRRFGDFTYFWEQEAFDAVTRMTTISLSFRIEKTKQTIKRAFTYQWRLWTIPEVRDCMEEAGFRKVHVWMREVGEAGIAKAAEEDTRPLAHHRQQQENLGSDDEEEEDPRSADFEEVLAFPQCEAWNAYIVGVS